jgi:hypothetical protein
MTVVSLKNCGTCTDAPFPCSMPSTTVGDKLCTSTVFPTELELHVRATVESEMENSLPFYACWNRD